jgi:glutamate racemase
LSLSAQAIGVYDSGIGGLSVLKALRAELPNEDFIYIADSGHAPYGERDAAHVMARSLAVTAYLVQQNIKALVVACNTATAAAIDLLRATYPARPIIGVEPALKPAVAMSRTKHIAVMATRGTLTSARFAALLAAQSGKADFRLLPCDGLAEAIERSTESSNASESIAVCARILEEAGLLGSLKDSAQRIDTIVLGCTHYPLIAPYIAAQVGPDIQLIDTGEAVARQTRQRLGDQLSTGHKSSVVELLSTGNPTGLHAAANAWLGLSSDVKILSI